MDLLGEFLCCKIYGFGRRKYSLLRFPFKLTTVSASKLQVFVNVSDFELGDHFCSFKFKGGIVEKDYQIHFSDEYPG